MNQDLRVQRVIFVALLASLGFYCAFAFMLGQRNAGRPLADELRNPMVITLYVAGGITFLAAIFLRSRFSERKLPMRTTNVVFWVMMEAITIYGLMLSFVLFDWRLIVAPAFVSVAGFVMTWPQEETT